MIYLASTSDKLQVVTSSANAVHVHASYVDLSGSTVTPDRADTSIAAATTTDIVTSPGASTTRKIKFLSVFNDHATAAQDIVVRHTDGTTTVDLWAASVPAQSGVIFDEKSGWRVMRADVPSNIQTFDAPGGLWVKPTNFKPIAVLIRLWGGGGGGGGGASLATAVVAKGGAGGGGAVCVTRIIPADLMPDTASVVIGFGGAGGAGGVAGGAGAAGNNGQPSYVSRAIGASGGRGGTGGQNSGGSFTTGGVGVGGHDIAGATTNVGFSVTAISGASSAAVGPNWEGGGGGGGSTNSSTLPINFAGGTSRWGGGGGGSGGCHSNVPDIVNASAGGGTGNGVGTISSGLGGAAGASGATPTSGANGTDTTGLAGGTGGGGGGTTVTASTNGANGGNGGTGGGGGGGGGVGMNPGVGGNGGNGGNGFGVIMTW